jgi:hypothetical protein
MRKGERIEKNCGAGRDKLAKGRLRLLIDKVVYSRNSSGFNAVKSTKSQKRLTTIKQRLASKLKIRL